MQITRDFRGGEAMSARKVKQMRQVLGDGPSEESLVALLRASELDVPSAIAAFFEQEAAAPTPSRQDKVQDSPVGQGAVKRRRTSRRSTEYAPPSPHDPAKAVSSVDQLHEERENEDASNTITTDDGEEKHVKQQLLDEATVENGSTRQNQTSFEDTGGLSRPQTDTVDCTGESHTVSNTNSDPHGAAKTMTDHPGILDLASFADMSADGVQRILRLMAGRLGEPFSAQELGHVASEDPDAVLRLLRGLADKSKNVTIETENYLRMGCIDVPAAGPVKVLWQKQNDAARDSSAPVSVFGTSVSLHLQDSPVPATTAQSSHAAVSSSQAARSTTPSRMAPLAKRTPRMSGLRRRRPVVRSSPETTTPGLRDNCGASSSLGPGAEVADAGVTKAVSLLPASVKSLVGIVGSRTKRRTSLTPQLRMRLTEEQQLQVEISELQKEIAALEKTDLTEHDPGETKAIEALVQKWRTAAQQAITELASRWSGDSGGRPGANIKQLLSAMGIEHSLVMYNEEDEEFEEP